MLLNPAATADRKQNRGDINTFASVSMSGVFNFLDGLFTPNDCIIFITTNHPEKLDEALIRPGRVDYKMQVGSPRKQDIENYLSLFFGKAISIDNIKGGMQMSDIKSMCLTYSDDPDKVIELLHS